MNGTVARLSDGPQLHLQLFPQISDARAQRTAAVANFGKEGRDTARQCRPLSRCELIRLTHHHEQGRALSAIDVVRGRLVINFGPKGHPHYPPTKPASGSPGP